MLTDSTLPGPALGRAAEDRPLREPALLSHHLADPGQFDPERLVGDDDVVEAVGHLAGHPRPFQGHAGREITPLDLSQDGQQDGGVE